MIFVLKKKQKCNRKNVEKHEAKKIEGKEKEKSFLLNEKVSDEF